MEMRVEAQSNIQQRLAWYLEVVHWLRNNSFDRMKEKHLEVLSVHERQFQSMITSPRLVLQLPSSTRQSIEKPFPERHFLEE